MDQFYWLVDDHTLLGHQMPVAIVAMRPERYLVEPNSYWDHGLMREFCPTAEHLVIGDSDEFLMLELRGEAVAREQLSAGLPEPAEIARNTISFMTDYQRDMACHPLTLHSRDLPPDVDEERQKLRKFVDETLSHLPAVLPSHIDHPQWDYHRPGFVEARHNYLASRYPEVGKGQEPKYLIGEADSVWWSLNQFKTSYERELRKLQRLLSHHRKVEEELLTSFDRAYAFRRTAIMKRLVSLTRNAAKDDQPAPDMAPRKAEEALTELIAATKPKWGNTQSPYVAAIVRCVAYLYMIVL
jgi:hypothetical protein